MIEDTNLSLQWTLIQACMGHHLMLLITRILHCRFSWIHLNYKVCNTIDHHGGCKNFYWRGVLNFDSENTEFFSVLGSFHKPRNISKKFFYVILSLQEFWFQRSGKIKERKKNSSNVKTIPQPLPLPSVTNKTLFLATLVFFRNS